MCLYLKKLEKNQHIDKNSKKYNFFLKFHNNVLSLY